MLTDKALESYDRLDDWFKNILSSESSCGYIYSGDPVIGWSWSNDISYSRKFSEGLKHYKDGSIGLNTYPSSDDIVVKVKNIPSEPQTYIEIIDRLLTEMGISSKLTSELTDGIFSFYISFKYKDEAYELCGSGEERLESFLNLSRELSEFYFVNKMPSIKDFELSRSGFFPIPDSVCDDEFASIDIFEDEHLEMSIDINDTQVCHQIMFNNYIFVLNEGEENSDFNYVRRHYHGKIQTLEGDVNIYSHYNIPA